MPYRLPLIPDSFASYIEKWADNRQPEPGDTASIIRQRLYILPTKHGITFFFILILVLTGAINYENSLAFMLTFLFSSICFLGMIYSHQNINNLSFRSSPAKPVFSGQISLFPVSIKTNKKQSHFSICLETEKSPIIRCNLLQQQDESNVTISIETSKRGYLSLDKIKISTEFPLGLFHAWSWINLKAKCLVYPAPEKHPFQFSQYTNRSGRNSQQQPGYDDFSGIREYQKEDPPNHLAWKAIAKTGILQTKQFHNNKDDDIYLSWFDLPDAMQAERRLSIICYWIIEAEKQGIKYGLKLPALNIKPESGLHHYQNCLKELALFGK